MEWPFFAVPHLSNPFFAVLPLFSPVFHDFGKKREKRVLKNGGTGKERKAFFPVTFPFLVFYLSFPGTSLPLTLMLRTITCSFYFAACACISWLAKRTRSLRDNAASVIGMPIHHAH